CTGTTYRCSSTRASYHSLPPLYNPRTYFWVGASRPASCAGSASHWRQRGGCPVTSVTAVRAASSSVCAPCSEPSPTTDTPTKLITTGLRASLTAPSNRAATSGDGGLEMSTITSVPGSEASAEIPASAVRPPTAWLRSRPPVPIACETPAPPRCTSDATSWMPVPAAPTSPSV